MVEKYKYGRIPIILNGELFNNVSTACSDMLDFAVYNYAIDYYAETSDCVEDAINKALVFYELPTEKHGAEIAHSILFNINEVMSRTEYCEVFFMCKVDKIREFMTTNKKPKEINHFAFHNAFNSILGIKKQCFTNYTLVVSRVLGFKTMKHLKQHKMPSYKKKFLEAFTDSQGKWKYNRFKTIKKHLMNSWFMVFDDWKKRGGYFTMGNKMTPEHFFNSVKLKKKSSNISKAERLKELMQKINSE